MNIAVIFAGGTGQRMHNTSTPKQFLELYSKPIIVYTIEKFENNQQIDGIIIACLESWMEYMQELVDRYNLIKVKAIVPGGKTGQLSIYNALTKASELYPSDSLVLIHDGVRPLIEEETISSVIACAYKNNNAITVVPATETVVILDDSGEVEEIVERRKCQYARAPQCFCLKDLLDAHHKALSEDLNNFIDSASIMTEYGHRLFTVEGKPENIKITTPSDFYVFKAYIDAETDKDRGRFE